MKSVKPPKSKPVVHKATQRQLIEQPSLITGRRWFFLCGYGGGFGAEYGITLDKRTVAARCAKKAGPGRLVKVKDLWYWQRECQAGQDGECAHPKCPQIRDGEPGKTGRHCPLPPSAITALREQEE
jgi:hypothetical protein